MKINKIKTDGKGNITITDVSNSTISIDTSSNEKILEFIENLQAWHFQRHSNILNIIVLTTTKNKVESFIASENANYLPLELYGDGIPEWKPFFDEAAIAAILYEFQQASGFRIEAYFIDDFELNDALASHLKDDISPNTILVLDCIALCSKNNKTFAKIFDKNDIGGCIVPICEKHSESSKKKMIQLYQSTLTHLNQCFWNRFKKEYMHVELVVPSKKILFRRLTNIAAKKLNIRQVSIPWSADLNQFKGTDVFDKLNPSL